jgi:hypothetical protein
MSEMTSSNRSRPNGQQTVTDVCGRRWPVVDRPVRQTELVSTVVLLDVQVKIAVILPILGAVACGRF